MSEEKSARMKALWEDPEYRASMTGENNPMFGRKHSRKSKNRQRAVKLGALNPNWKGDDALGHAKYMREYRLAKYMRECRLAEWRNRNE